MVFYSSLNNLAEKIHLISKDEKLRKFIAMKGKKKYIKYFNSNLVADYIINTALERKINKKKFIWHKN